jgi:hypothetical protein
MALPKLFIGSSNESRPMGEVLADLLAPVADVTPWYADGVFPPTHSYIESLVQLPERFDFGVFLFEPDDRVVSRGKDAMAPRDNVVFEFGLFMHRLGIPRTFAVAPRGGVKVLSDYAGYQPFDYQETKDLQNLRANLDTVADGAAKEAVREGFKKAVASALDGRVTEMKRFIQKMGPMAPTAPRVKESAPSAIEVTNHLKLLVNESLDRYGSASVMHLGLDLSAVWDPLKEVFFRVQQVARSQKAGKITWRCLIINPDSSAIQQVASDSVDILIARAKIHNIHEFMKANRATLDANDISFACRMYSDLPLMHGFLIERVALLWSTCGWTNGKLEAAVTPYWEFPADDPLARSAHPARTFAEWFEYRWQSAVDI